MNKNQLRIGNWIEFNQPKKGIYTTVTESTFEWDIEKAFKPITLTKKWLVNFGFAKSSNEFYTNEIIGDNMSKYKLCFRINDNISDCLINEFVNNFEEYNTICPKFIKYVHQLQNLYFALTGEELTLKTEL